MNTSTHQSQDRELKLQRFRQLAENPKLIIGSRLAQPSAESRNRLTRQNLKAPLEEARRRPA
jgi:hypothetical protein